MKKQEFLDVIAKRNAEKSEASAQEKFLGTVSEAFKDFKGPQGEKGDKGDKGEPGIDGRDGINGLHGSDGKDGINGRNGSDGKDGEDGEKGMPGKDGSPDTPLQIAEKINTLDRAINATAINGMLTIEEIVKAFKKKKLLGMTDIANMPLNFNDQRWHGGGPKVSVGGTYIQDPYSNFNFIAGAGTSITYANDINNERVNITIANSSPESSKVSVSINDTTPNYLNNKLLATSPLVKTLNNPGGDETLTLSIPAASSSVNGYLTSTDWATFNNKVSSQWVTSGSDIYYTTGRVSIGTTTPYAKFDINGGSIASQFHISSSGADSGLYFTTADENNFFMSGGASFNGSTWIAKATSASIIGGDNGEFKFYTNGGLTPGASFGPIDRMIIDSSGRIGIGTPSPSQMLDVNGNVIVTGNIETTWNASLSYVRTYFNSSYNMGMQFDPVGRALTLFSLTGDTTGGHIILSPDPTRGGVGIGVTTPLSTLHLKAGSATANTAPLQFNSGSVETTARAGLIEYNGNFYNTKTGNVRYGVGGALFDHYDDVSNVTTGETDLYSDSIKANTITQVGDKISATYGLLLTGSTSSKRVRAYFAGNVIFDSAALPVSVAGAMILYVELIAESTSVIRTTVSATATGPTTVGFAQINRFSSQNFSIANILKITGQASGVGAATGDIIASSGHVSFLPAAI